MLAAAVSMKDVCGSLMRGSPLNSVCPYLPEAKVVV